MQNAVQEGKTLTFTAPTGGVVSGGAYLIGGVLAVANADAAETEEFEGTLEGVFTLAKVTGTAWTAGDRLYWDNSTKKATKTASGNTLIGIAGADATSGATTGAVRLNGATDEAYAGGAAETLDPLTENAGAIGGTNDGDLPDLTATAAALTENAGAIGGTNDGDLPDLTATAAALTENAGAIGGTNDGDLPTLVDPAGDAGASVIAGIRETAVAINEIVADNVALRAAIRENAAALNEVVADNVALRAAIRENAAGINAIVTALTNLGLAAPTA